MAPHMTSCTMLWALSAVTSGPFALIAQRIIGRDHAAGQVGCAVQFAGLAAQCSVRRYHLEGIHADASTVSVNMRNTNQSAVAMQKVKSDVPSTVVMRKCTICQPCCAMQYPSLPCRRYACTSVPRCR